MNDELKSLLEKIEKGELADLTTEQLALVRTEVEAGLTAWKSDKALYSPAEVKSMVTAFQTVKVELDSRGEADKALDEEVTALIPEPAPEPEPEPVKTGNLKAILEKRPAQATPAPEAPAPVIVEEAEPQMEVLAASGNPGSAVAEDAPRLQTLEDIGQAMEAVYRGTSNPRAGEIRHRAIRKQWHAESGVDTDFKPQQNFTTLQTAIRDGQDRAKAAMEGSEVLQAATGICGPLEPRYNFLNLIGTDGLIDLPTVGVARGGLRLPQAVTWDDIDGQSAVAYPYTSQMGSDAGVKPCFEVECPGISDFLVIAYQTCLRFGNFTGQFFPEYVSHISDVAMAAHAHKVNLALILAIVANADTVTYDSNGATKLGGAWAQFVRQTTFHSWLYRSKYRTNQDLVLEHVYPYRALGAIIADTAARESSTPPDTAGRVIDAVMAHGREIGARFQWVHDWQEMTQAPGDFGSEAYSSLVFPAGEIVHMTGETLDLGVVRDSSYNSTNEFGTWVETFDGIATSGYEIMLVTDQRLCPNGEVGSNVTIACSTAS